MPKNDLILLDTNILIYAIRNRDGGISLFKALQKKRLQPAISAITEFELRIGNNTPQQDLQLDNFLASFCCLAVTPYTARIAANLLKPYRSDKNFLKAHLPDVLIASTALEHRINLYTKNVVDFQRLQINGISIFDNI